MSTDTIRIQDFLSQMPLFNELSPAELDRIAQGTSKVKVARRGTVFRYGDPCVGFHIVVYGLIKLSMASRAGEEKILRFIGPGDGFGEALMFLGKDYIVSAHALADTLLLHVSNTVIFAELDRDPAFARKMLAGLSGRLHAMVTDVKAYSLQSGTQRVISYLLHLADDDSHGTQHVRLETGKKTIASRLNVTPEHFSRILRDLTARQLIEVNARNITIVDIDRLRAEEVGGPATAQARIRPPCVSIED